MPILQLHLNVDSIAYLKEFMALPVVLGKIYWSISNIVFIVNFQVALFLPVTGGYDHKIRFWEATSGVCAKTLLFNESQLNCLQISPDKSLLAAGGNPQIQIFDINSGEDKSILTYDGHSNNVTHVGFQQDIKWIYSSSEDGTVKIWDPRTNSYTRSYDCGSAVNTVALNPNQAELISGDQNGCVKVWDLEADKCREEYVPAPDIPVRSISIVSRSHIFESG